MRIRWTVPAADASPASRLCHTTTVFLSQKNRALLMTIAETHPVSLQELADRTGRKTSNLSRTLKTMERYGFVRLHRGERGRIRPEVPYQSISLELPFNA